MGLRRNFASRALCQSFRRHNFASMVSNKRRFRDFFKRKKAREEFLELRDIIAKNLFGCCVLLAC